MGILYNKLTKEQKQDIYDKYSNRKSSVLDIAKEYGFNSKTFSRVYNKILKDLNIPVEEESIDLSFIKYCESSKEESIVQHASKYGVLDTAIKNRCSIKNINKTLQTIKRLASKQGYSPEHDMTKPTAPGFAVKRVSSYYKDGDLANQWVISEPGKEEQFNMMKEAISELVETHISSVYKPLKNQPQTDNDDLITMYISNDIHFGALMWSEETQDRDWDLKIAEKTVKHSFDHLIKSSPESKSCIILDLGDLLEADSFENRTPKSGHVLAVDGRYPKILKTAYLSLIYGIEKALEKHETVYFINIAGNHDVTVGHTVREVVSAWFRNEPRVIVDQSPSNIKYHQFGENLFQFAHGDGMRMNSAGETLAVDMRHILSSVVNCYSHFGHNHKDSTHDGRITKCESHRNLAPLNEWASHMGFRRNLGTMKCITYHKKYGEWSRNLFNVSMTDDLE